MVVEGEFIDDHRTEWLERLARDGEAIIAVGEQGPDAFSNFAEWSATWHMRVVPVATYMGPRGVGVTRSAHRSQKAAPVLGAGRGPVLVHPAGIRPLDGGAGPMR